MRNIVFWGCFGCLLGLYSCIDELPLNDNSAFDVLVVEANLSDLSEQQLVRLSRSKSDATAGFSYDEPINDAQVELVIDNTQTLHFQALAGGKYSLTDVFVAQSGHRYQLRFQLSNGREYESSVELMPPPCPIQKVYQQFNEQSLPPQQIKGFLAANDFYMDYDDSAAVENYYSWDWTLWERQYYCYAGPYFDLACNRECWEIIHNTTINISNDKYSNGNKVIGRRVAQIPYYQKLPCLVEIRQESISKGRYNYLKLVAEQTKNTGTLVDTPPAALIGNIRNIQNTNEPVIGYFAVSSISKTLYWLERTENTGEPITLFRGLYGRSINLARGESPCVESDIRTARKPIGWRL
ncbi:MAG: DUF4249 domain-containing protein [Spirosomataceae bacterium]